MICLLKLTLHSFYCIWSLTIQEKWKIEFYSLFITCSGAGAYRTVDEDGRGGGYYTKSLCQTGTRRYCFGRWMCIVLRLWKCRVVVVGVSVRGGRVARGWRTEDALVLGVHVKYTITRQVFLFGTLLNHYRTGHPTSISSPEPIQTIDGRIY